MLHEDQVISEAQKDIAVAVEALRRAIRREDLELGPDGIGNRLALINDELLALI